MISDSLRRNGEQSPKSSPRAARSPLVQGSNRQDTTGTLKTTIILGGKQPSILNSGPFYLLKEPAGNLTVCTMSRRVFDHFGVSFKQSLIYHSFSSTHLLFSRKWTDRSRQPDSVLQPRAFVQQDLSGQTHERSTEYFLAGSTRCWRYWYSRQHGQ